MKIQMARLELVTELPFFGSIFLRMMVGPDPDCKTAWTDGRSIGFNPDWMGALPIPQIKGVFVHEVLHIALKHHLREELNPIFKEHHQKFNRAADYALNPSVMKTPGCDLPDNVCLDLQKWPDNLAEEIFAVLKDDEKLKGGGTGQGTDVGEVRPFQEGKASPAEKAAESATVDQWINAASFKGQGNMTGAANRIVSNTHSPAVCWQDEIQIMIDDLHRSDYTWTRPNVRYMQQGMYLPSMKGRHTPDMVFYVDTSGSLNDDMLSKIMAEIRSIIGAFRCRVIVVYWDTGYNGHEEFNPEDVLDPSWSLTGKGGGGTSFTDCWDFLDDQDEIDPEGIIFFTDCECRRWPEEDPGVPVIWCQVPGSGGTFRDGYQKYMPEYGSRVKIPVFPS